MSPYNMCQVVSGGPLISSTDSLIHSANMSADDMHISRRFRSEEWSLRLLVTVVV